MAAQGWPESLSRQRRGTSLPALWARCRSMKPGKPPESAPGPGGAGEVARVRSRGGVTPLRHAGDHVGDPVDENTFPAGSGVSAPAGVDRRKLSLGEMSRVTMNEWRWAGFVPRSLECRASYRNAKFVLSGSRATIRPAPGDQPAGMRILGDFRPARLRWMSRTPTSRRRSSTAGSGGPPAPSNGCPAAASTSTKGSRPAHRVSKAAGG